KTDTTKSLNSTQQGIQEDISMQTMQSSDIQTPPQAPSQTPPIEELPEQETPTPSLKVFETEVMDKILEKSDMLAQSLQKLQEQFHKQEQEMGEKINAARIESKEEGYKEGYESAKKELQDKIEEQQQLYALSIKRLEDNITQSKEHILKLEKELGSIALDIAKEVITTEVNNNSAKIASSLARSLLENITKNTEVTLKVFPGDLEDLKESLKDLSAVKIESDPAIAKGGVIILSNEGNIDGDLQLRFAMLKKSILQNKE
ncbi:MAG: flagellar assembly protein FliH, partial [Helicobacter sp.]|nr:flagellar assembly protein FliH [Helicobacter sp.]